MNDQLPSVIYLHRIFFSDCVPCEDVTWCQNRMSEEDVKYIRKDLVDSLISLLYQHHNSAYIEHQDLSSECMICGGNKLLSLLDEIKE